MTRCDKAPLLLLCLQVPLFQSYSATYYQLKQFVVRRANGKRTYVYDSGDGTLYLSVSGATTPTHTVIAVFTPK